MKAFLKTFPQHWNRTYQSQVALGYFIYMSFVTLTPLQSNTHYISTYLIAILLIDDELIAFMFIVWFLKEEKTYGLDRCPHGLEF